ncbi:enoyl-CoA hydratase-related protein [Paraburkholderia azotifigens]|uniref:enoyl-CoA hydratase-related protein n=1 Tax=Paraburkholderia azotifigens TaxID=2057004 RepID=UPI0031767AD0
MGNQVLDLFAGWDGMRSISTPVIAAVAGYAKCSGFELAMACDFMVAPDNAPGSVNRRSNRGFCLAAARGKRGAQQRVRDVIERRRVARVGGHGQDRACRQASSIMQLCRCYRANAA